MATFRSSSLSTSVLSHKISLVSVVLLTGPQAVYRFSCLCLPILPQVSGVLQLWTHIQLWPGFWGSCHQTSMATAFNPLSHLRPPPKFTVYMFSPPVVRKKGQWYLLKVLQPCSNESLRGGEGGLLIKQVCRQKAANNPYGTLPNSFPANPNLLWQPLFRCALSLSNMD